MKKLRFAVFGTGFWANYQIPAWMELDGVELVALYNRTRAKAESLARTYNVPAIYDSAAELLEKEDLDFVDIITDVDTHALFTEMAARKKIAIICQKPMAPKFPAAERMVDICAENNVPLLIHENWRWQAPIRKVKELLQTDIIGDVFKGRVSFCSGFPVFENQPFLAQLEEFILTDIGSHILDVCRFLFGEAETLYCTRTSVNKNIRGEDVANVLMRMKNGISCYAEMSYASVPEYEIFPQTLVVVEGSHGTIELRRDYRISITTKSGTDMIEVPPRMYSWVDPAYALVHSSIVDCNRDILSALQGRGQSETTGMDNLETVRLVHAAYASAANNSVVNLNQFP